MESKLSIWERFLNDLHYLCNENVISEKTFYEYCSQFINANINN